jgi:hypothetical protein
LFDFLVAPDGRRITCRDHGTASREAFLAYLLGQVLSYALIRQGQEPIHSTVVEADGEAVGLLGNCGYGKSTLAAAFLREGWRLLTDDMLLLGQEGDVFVSYPGPPRIKLFPEGAQALLGEQAAGSPMNPYTPKLLIPLGPESSCRVPVPLRSLYVLSPPAERAPRERVSIQPLNQRGALLAVIANTFNAQVTEPDRLARQFSFAGRVCGAVPIKSLSYPHGLTSLPQVVEAVRADLARRRPRRAAPPNCCG